MWRIITRRGLNRRAFATPVVETTIKPSIIPLTHEDVPASPRVTSTVSNFNQLREHNFLLVDKTKYLERMIAMDNKFMISRPPRFGKTLMITTLSSLFRGQKHLFDGTVGTRLAIADSSWDWRTESHSVLSFDMEALARRRGFRDNMLEMLRRQCDEMGVRSHADSIKGSTEDLILGAAARSPSGKVVILVDELDAAVSNVLHIGETEKMIEATALNARTMNDFLGVINTLESRIRFQMYTGVGMLAVPGKLVDLSLGEHFSSMCGYTEEEVHMNFQEHINALRLRLKIDRDELYDQIRAWYGGYSWGDTHSEALVYNPFAINQLMCREQFGPHWSSASDHMLWLHDILRESPSVFSGRIPFKTGKAWRATVDTTAEKKTMSEDDMRVLLLRLGLLTIKQVETDPVTLMKYGVLGVPNRDVNDFAVRPIIDSLYLASAD